VLFSLFFLQKTLHLAIFCGLDHCFVSFVRFLPGQVESTLWGRNKEMKRPLRFLCVIAIAVAAQTNFATGATIAVVPVGNISTAFDPRPFMIGWEFSVWTTTHITGLAYLDQDGDGLGDSHRIGIFDAASQSLLVSETVDAGLSPPLIDGFRVVPESFTLHPGIYVIGGQSLSVHDLVRVGATATNTIAGIAYIQERELQTSAFVMPTINEPSNEVGIFGPSFVVGPLRAPEPTTIALLGIGLAGLGFWRRRS
jgi:hypothetical protein